MIRDEIDSQNIKEETEIQIEANLEVRKKALSVFLIYKDYLNIKISKGCLILENGRTISKKELTEVSMDILLTSHKLTIIDEEQLLRFGYAFARSFGQSGMKLFVKIEKCCIEKTYWSLVSLYKSCIEKSHENYVEISEFWLFASSLITPSDMSMDERSEAA